MSDMIYRQDAIDAVSRGCQEFRGIFAECEKNLNVLPSAQPERLKGEWIPIGVRHGWICSKCRKENVYAFRFDDNGEYVLQDYFCPNCGADMRDDDIPIEYFESGGI